MIFGFDIFDSRLYNNNKETHRFQFSIKLEFKIIHKLFEINTTMKNNDSNE